jgi:hypothetical protein
MSRRKGQLGHIEKHGKYYTVRVWMDVPGQEEREHVRIKISPFKKGSPGWLNASERQNRAKEILAESGVNSAASFNAVVKAAPSLHTRTFAEQAEVFLEKLRQRDDPASDGTLYNWEKYIRKWLNPMLGDLPLEKVGNAALQRTASWMKKGGPCPSERNVNEEE